MTKKITLPIVESFISIQGEGRESGRLAYFIRTPGCNLKCAFCDTTYASRIDRKKGLPKEKKKHMKIRFVQKIELTTIAEQIKHLSEALERDIDVVITGGEPLLFREKIKELIRMIPSNPVQIETNGTLKPITFEDTELPLFNNISYNISPKLDSSKNSYKKAIRISNLKSFFEVMSYYPIFKFVIKNNKDWGTMEKIIKKVNIPKEQVYIMPEGKTDLQVKKNAEKLFIKIISNGYNLSPRLHVWLFGNKKVENETAIDPNSFVLTLQCAGKLDRFTDLRG